MSEVKDFTEIAELVAAIDDATGDIWLVHWICACRADDGGSKADCGSNVLGITVDQLAPYMEICRRCEAIQEDPAWRCPNCGKFA